MTEVNETEVTDELVEIREAFDNATSQEKDEDDVKMDMIGAGARFKNVTRLFNQFMVDSGLIKSKEEKSEILDKVLGDVDLTDPENFDSVVAELAEELDVTEKSAAGSLRQWAKKSEVEFYKKPKGSGTGRSGITSKIYAWIVENPTGTEDELFAMLKEVGTENTMNHKGAYSSILKLANDIVSKYA